MHMMHIDFVTDFLWVKFYDKKCDSLGKFKVFVLGVGCWGWVIEGGKMHMIRIDLVMEFSWVNFGAKK